MNVAGLQIWGSPWTPAFGRWAFQHKGDEAMAAVWAQVPAGLDVLITHGPPRGLGDRTFFGARAGCAALRQALERARPRHHLFGHIHEAAGSGEVPYEAPGATTRWHNVASRRLARRGVRPPVVLEL